MLMLRANVLVRQAVSDIPMAMLSTERPCGIFSCSSKLMG